jgi:Activator of Hsp90 ATPase homolog 1-like protein
LIELEFSERDGRTTVLMTNSSIPTEERWESQQRGWNVCYDNLEHVLAG